MAFFLTYSYSFEITGERLPSRPRNINTSASPNDSPHCGLGKGPVSYLKT